MDSNTYVTRAGDLTTGCRNRWTTMLFDHRWLMDCEWGWWRWSAPLYTASGEVSC